MRKQKIPYEIETYEATAKMEKYNKPPYGHQEK